MSRWVPDMVSSRGRRRLVAWGFVVAGALWLGWAQRRYLANFLAGPFETGTAELDAIADPAQAPRYFVKVSGSKALETGFEEITIRKKRGVEVGRSVSARYYGLVVGEKLLLYKGNAGPRTVVEGELTRVPREVETGLLGTPEMAARRAGVYPFLLSATGSFRLPGYVALGGLLVLLVLLAVKAVPAWREASDPSTHPLLARMKAWEDPAGATREAEREARSPRLRGAGWKLTDGFFIRSTFFTFDLARLGDLVWAYKKVTKHSINFIPTGKSHEAVLAFPGASFTIKARERKVDQILGFAAERAPWAILGFSEPVRALFATKPEQVQATVAQRRAEWAENRRGSPA